MEMLTRSFFALVCMFLKVFRIPSQVRRLRMMLSSGQPPMLLDRVQQNGTGTGMPVAESTPSPSAFSPVAEPTPTLPLYTAISKFAPSNSFSFQVRTCVRPVFLCQIETCAIDDLEFKDLDLESLKPAEDAGSSNTHYPPAPPHASLPLSSSQPAPSAALLPALALPFLSTALRQAPMCIAPLANARAIPTLDALRDFDSRAIGILLAAFAIIAGLLAVAAKFTFWHHSSNKSETQKQGLKMRRSASAPGITTPPAVTVTLRLDALVDVFLPGARFVNGTIVYNRWNSLSLPNVVHQSARFGGDSGAPSSPFSKTASSSGLQAESKSKPATLSHHSSLAQNDNLPGGVYVDVHCANTEKGKSPQAVHIALDLGYDTSRRHGAASSSILPSSTAVEGLSNMHRPGPSSSSRTSWMLGPVCSTVKRTAVEPTLNMSALD